MTSTALIVAALVTIAVTALLIAILMRINDPARDAKSGTGVNGVVHAERADADAGSDGGGDGGGD